MTDPLGQSQVLPYIIGLSKEGYEFHLISFEKTDRFQEHFRHIKGICKANNIHWHPQDYQLGGGLKTTLKQVRRMRKIAGHLHKRHQFSIVHCRSYISALVGLRLKRKHRVKFVFDMRGFWADERVDGKLWDLNKRLYKTIYNYFKKKELEFFKESDYTISLTETGKNEIESWEAFQGNLPKIQVIPCCVDLELFDSKSITEQRKQELAEKIGLKPEHYVLGYIGSIGTWYMLSEMLDYFKCLREENENAVFLFVTREKPEVIHAEAKKKGIDTEALFITPSLHKDVPVHLSLFDYSIFFIRPTYSKKASSPTKQGEIMAMGIPLVCNSGVGDTDIIIQRYKAGTVIETMDENAYKSNLSNPAEFDREMAQQGAREYFALKEGVKRYLEVYQSFDD